MGKSSSIYNMVVKRAADFAISLAVMPIVGLICLGSAVAIKLDDGGPVFYRARRTGLEGKPFDMLKLRSMKVNAPDIRLADGSTYNGKDDPRVTRFGRFARKTSIDEFPQFFNVLVGDMAIVGPRPDSASYLDKYTDEERVILSVRPGITGYNQAINRNAVGTKEKLQNDIYYVENISLAFDMKILLMTVKSVLYGTSVYRRPENSLSTTESDLSEDDHLKSKSSRS